MSLLRVILYSATAFFMLACNQNIVYEEHISPPGNLEWKRDDAIKFDIDIVDTSIKYNEYITFRHATGYAFSACSLRIAEKLPNGEELIHHLTLKTADSQGYLSDCSGDICDLEELWREKWKFGMPGTYHYEISHEMTNDKVQMVMDVGMKLEMSKAAFVR